MDAPGVVLVAPPADTHAMAVRTALDSIGVPVIQFDFATVAHHPLSVVPGRYVRIGDDEIVDGMSVWWRRGGVRAPRFDHRPDEARTAADETRDIVVGGLLSLRLRWVDEPFTVMRAEHTLYQLATAAEVGASVPVSLATNDPDAGRELHSGGPIIAKSISFTLGLLVHVEPVTADELPLLANAPTFLQRNIEGVADLRVPVVGDRAYCWSRPKRPDELVDWRAEDPAGSGFRYAPDERVERAAVAINQRLGLTFGVQDWVLDPAGEPLFLEVNPCGAWLFLPGAAETVAPDLARLLAGRD
jgi:hypothetical protein